ncbi:RCC1 domain-containing protein [Gemmatimonas sp.]|uniref:RCC1 domain-containing protein n=1 Tax=Gemmatimonas sp. TaxID=1962908 RepID=UPI0035665E52
MTPRCRPRGWITADLLLTLSLALSACDAAAVNNPYAGRAVPTPVTVSGSRQYARVSAGFFHSCAVTAGGEGWCWGSNEYLQVGVASTPSRCEQVSCSRTPLRVAGSLMLVDIAAGVTSTCALTTVGRAYCWGGGYPGVGSQLGDSAIVSSATPVRVKTDSTFAQITVGGSHSCALTAGGTALCWGGNQFGQLGNGSVTSSATPIVVSGTLRFASISASSTTTCAVALSGIGYCWGSNRWGQMGVGDVPYNSLGLAEQRPREISGDLRWAQIAAGFEHTCGVTTSGTALCWGLNENAGQLGNGTSVSHRGVPGPVAGGRSYDGITAGAVANCAHTPGNELYCWGSNYFGGLGNGQTQALGVNQPVKNIGGSFRGGEAARHHSAGLGSSHGCAIKTDGSVSCWGDAFYGQTGDR